MKIILPLLIVFILYTIGLGQNYSQLRFKLTDEDTGNTIYKVDSIFFIKLGSLKKTLYPSDFSFKNGILTIKNLKLNIKYKLIFFCPDYCIYSRFFTSTNNEVFLNQIRLLKKCNSESTPDDDLSCYISSKFKIDKLLQCDSLIIRPAILFNRVGQTITSFTIAYEDYNGKFSMYMPDPIFDLKINKVCVKEIYNELDKIIKSIKFKSEHTAGCRVGLKFMK